MQKLLILVGPTASGKTAVACEIAKRLPVEMISCDSMQVYRRMPILTQVPSKTERAQLKAHLVSFLDPSKEYNAAFFRRDAQKAIEKIHKNSSIPFLVGGTGLYLRALLDGIFESAQGVSKDDPLRQKLMLAQEKHGGNYLHEKLKNVDAISAAKIHPNDFRRLVRALEVQHVTGKPFSEQKSHRRGLRDTYCCRIFLLDRDRQDLYARIERRVEAMAEKGILREVKMLKRKKIGLTASMALGLREMSEVLEGRCNFEQAVQILKKNTRHYAKRQLSWFRHERGVEKISVLPDDSPRQISEKIIRLWRHA
jgi:tRNA dimethylallyltransferase